MYSPLLQTIAGPPEKVQVYVAAMNDVHATMWLAIRIVRRMRDTVRGAEAARQGHFPNGYYVKKINDDMITMIIKLGREVEVSEKIDILYTSN